MSNRSTTAITAAFVVLVIAVCIGGFFMVAAWEDRDCHSKGAERVNTSGLQYICVDKDGRIVP